MTNREVKAGDRIKVVNATQAGGYYKDGDILIVSRVDEDNRLVTASARIEGDRAIVLDVEPALYLREFVVLQAPVPPKIGRALTAAASLSYEYLRSAYINFKDGRCEEGTATHTLFSADYTPESILQTILDGYEVAEPTLQERLEEAYDKVLRDERESWFSGGHSSTFYRGKKMALLELAEDCGIDLEGSGE